MTPIYLESDMKVLQRAYTGEIWSPEERKRVRRDRWIGMAAAAVVHAALLVGGAGLLTEQAQYGLDLGGNGLEVDLIAAPAPMTTEAVPAIDEAPAPAEAPPASAPDTEDFALPEPEPVRTAAAAPAPSAAADQPVLRADTPLAVYGDGSSPVAGADATSIRAAGAIVQGAQPHYLKNPPPAYPEASRRAKEEGLVLLSALIDEKGKALTVTIKSGSGYERLDASALRAVKNWRFRPATLGGLPVQSQADIPVRFKLDA